ncbi:conserved exported hypothetical protein [Rhodospirillaceae bacterium LM-1]|nr:conserved exported hypothetical protein [Rhodospirillaceae bacterium LM-1]
MMRTRRKAMAWTGLYLLAFNLIAGALMPAQAAAPLSQLVSQTYICTALGMTAVGPDAGQTPASQAGHTTAFCVFCLPLMQGGLDGPAAQAALVKIDFPSSLAEYAPVASHISGQLARHGKAAPRAPPVS